MRYPINIKFIRFLASFHENLCSLRLFDLYEFEKYFHIICNKKKRKKKSYIKFIRLFFLRFSKKITKNINLKFNDTDVSLVLYLVLTRFQICYTCLCDIYDI